MIIITVILQFTFRFLGFVLQPNKKANKKTYWSFYTLLKNKIHTFSIYIWQIFGQSIQSLGLFDKSRKKTVCILHNVYTNEKTVDFSYVFNTRHLWVPKRSCITFFKSMLFKHKLCLDSVLSTLLTYQMTFSQTQTEDKRSVNRAQRQTSFLRDG